MKLRTIGMAAVAALSLVAGRAEAQDAGWDTQYGILFTLPNLLQNGSSRVIEDYNGKVGAQYNLSPETAIRLSARLARTATGITESSAGTNTSETVPTYTSQYGVNLMGQYMIRMTPAAVSPYVGAGAFLGADLRAKKGEDKTNGTVTTEYDNTFRDIAFGVNGTVGLEWRIHKVISIFAEYEADLTLINSSTDKTKETSGAVTTETESKRKEFANFDMGIAQGGQLGIIAFF